MGRKARRPDVPKEFIDLVREKMKGRSLRDVAESANLSPSFLSRILSGKRNLPSEEELLRLAEVLGVNPPRILFAEGRRAHPEMVPLLRAASKLSKKELQQFTKQVEDVIRKHSKPKREK